MTRVYDISNEFVERIAALNPIAATSLGVPGYETTLGDFSPAGAEANAQLARNTLNELNVAPLENDSDRRAKEVMVEDISADLESHDRGEHFRRLNILHSPMQSIRMVFDHMPKVSIEEWSNIAIRLSNIPEALSGYEETLREGARRDLVSTVRQTKGCADQARIWSGSTDNPSFFLNYMSDFEASEFKSATVKSDLQKGICAAINAYGKFSEFLTSEYLLSADQSDGVGKDRYSIAAREYNGINLELLETYEWGWEQLRWVESEMAITASKILPGGDIDSAKELLESDPKRSIEGQDAFRHWMQELQDRTIDELDGTHFEIAEPVRKIEAMIAPPGGALAMYYTRPSGDFSRPGRTWYPTGGKTRFPLWGEVSIAYHEGVPGHHFQIGTSVFLEDKLSRYQRQLGGTSGYIEGWALYAERLMGELGYLDNPDYYLGMLRAQALRSVRVIIDIGMHLNLRIPSDVDFHPGEDWTPELGLDFIEQRSHFPKDFVKSEVDRYLGIPGQAISYKVGERVWLEARESAKSRIGPSFNLREWHTKALGLGGMGLAQMKRELAEI